MSDVVKFYKKNAAANPDVVLEKAIGEFESVIVLGWSKETETLDFRASTNIDHKEVNWLLGKAQQKLLNGDYFSD